MLPFKIQKFLVKKTSLQTAMEMISSFPEYLDEIGMMVDLKLKTYNKLMLQREENIYRLMSSLGVADKRKDKTPYYNSLYQNLTKVLVEEYKLFKKIKRSYLRFSLLRRGKKFLEGASNDI